MGRRRQFPLNSSTAIKLILMDTVLADLDRVALNSGRARTDVIREAVMSWLVNHDELKRARPRMARDVTQDDLDRPLGVAIPFKLPEGGQHD